MQVRMQIIRQTYANRGPAASSSYRVPFRIYSAEAGDSPAEHTPAVHVQDLAGDMTRQCRAEEYDRPGDVFG